MYFYPHSCFIPVGMTGQGPCMFRRLCTNFSINWHGNSYFFIMPLSVLSSFINSCWLDRQKRSTVLLSFQSTFCWWPMRLYLLTKTTTFILLIIYISSLFPSFAIFLLGLCVFPFICLNKIRAPLSAVSCHLLREGRECSRGLRNGHRE